MDKRIEWLKLVMQSNRLWNCLRQFLAFFVFEAYYQLCTLRGYRPRHVFLEVSPESLRFILPGERILMIWPSLPLSIRMLERIWPFAYGAHAEFVPYTPEDAVSARASGRRAKVVETVQGELRLGGSFK